MSVELINSHVLIPHPPNWRNAPRWMRVWENKISGTVVGSEKREAVRAIPRIRLQFTVSPKDLVEQNYLDDRLRAALKSGYACCPNWGRGQKLSADVSGTGVTLSSSTWTFAIGDYVFLMDAQRNYDVRTISGLASQTSFTLNTNVSRTYAAGLLIWPMLFGTLKSEAMNASSAHHSDTPITLEELVSPASNAVVGDYTPPDPEEDLAIPDQEIPTTNDVR